MALIGKRYSELTPTIALASDTLLSVYKIGQPENNSITFDFFQQNISISNLFDLVGETLSDKDFLKYSASGGKFIPGVIELSDIPNLSASKITSGVFDVARIPDLPISKITNLQTELDGKEPAFTKGDLVSSTLVLSNNIGRLFGSSSLAIDVDIAQIIEEVRNNLDFFSEEEFTFSGTYDFTLSQEPINNFVTVFLYHVGTNLGVKLHESLYDIVGTTLSIDSDLDVGDKIMISYYYDNPLMPNNIPTLQQVTDESNSTTNTIVHADAILSTESTTLSQVQTLISSFISDAPSDGSLYGRKDGAWELVDFSPFISETQGTFTPEFFSDGTAHTISYGDQIGRYIKVGNLIHFEIYLSWGSYTAGTGNLVINFTGLSETIAPNSLGIGCSLGRWENVNSPNDNAIIAGVDSDGSGIPIIRLSYATTSLAQQLQSADLSGFGELGISGTLILS